MKITIIAACLVGMMLAPTKSRADEKELDATSEPPQLTSAELKIWADRLNEESEVKRRDVQTTHLNDAIFWQDQAAMKRGWSGGFKVLATMEYVMGGVYLLYAASDPGMEVNGKRVSANVSAVPGLIIIGTGLVFHGVAALIDSSADADIHRAHAATPD